MTKCNVNVRGLEECKCRGVGLVDGGIRVSVCHSQTGDSL